MFNLKDYIKKGLLNAVGKMADYQVILNSVGWMEKGVLDEADLADINAKIEAQYAPEDAVIVDALPDGDISEYIYRDGEYIHEPVAQEEELCQ